MTPDQTAAIEEAVCMSDLDEAFARIADDFPDMEDFGGLAAHYLGGQEENFWPQRSKTERELVVYSFLAWALQTC